MKRFIKISLISLALVASATTYAGHGHQSSGNSGAHHPTPNVSDGQCNDRDWNVQGHWRQLVDGQYGAENLRKSGNRNKWKIVQRNGNKVHALHCDYPGYEMSEYVVNTQFAGNDGLFNCSDHTYGSGRHKTTLFCKYE